ncbi:hypothetical protein [Yersinia phage phiR8-01]|uniref:Uncharacterized protein n=1 Tax=Yersinia phage phiR8-01 TaxID=1206556 RepID=A0A1K2IXL1_9CAUD|nr:hypothetical protein HOT05_gp03 [Yersinia phage phiR8-01]SGA03416.1 hypothetical protein [Yersinia phage phiR8-01]
MFSVLLMHSSTSLFTFHDSSRSKQGMLATHYYRDTLLDPISQQAATNLVSGSSHYCLVPILRRSYVLVKHLFKSLCLLPS